MDLPEEQIKRVIKLSRIKMSDSETQQVGEELKGIMKWIDQLEEVDVTGVDLYSDVEFGDESMPEAPDEITQGNQVEAVLANAPSKAHNMYEVPKVVE